MAMAPTLAGGRERIASRHELAELFVGPHWRDEATTLIEYYIRYARAVGIHASEDVVSGGLRCWLTIDADDEQSITWPGKAMLPK